MMRRHLWRVCRGSAQWAVCLSVLAVPASASFSWLNTAWRTSTPRVTPSARTTPTRTAPTATAPATITPSPQPSAPATVVAPVGVPLVLSLHHDATQPARIYLTKAFATVGGWGVFWVVNDNDLWEPAQPSVIWYTHVGTPAVPPMPIGEVHRIDRVPVYLVTVSPDGTEFAVIRNELVNWKQLSRGAPGRVTYQFLGRMSLTGNIAWFKNPIETRLGVHGGIGDVVWTPGIIRVTTEATCGNAKHQCTYSQRVNPDTGAVVGRGSITTTWHGHETAPSIIPFDAKNSWLTTVSDIKQGGVTVWRNFLGGMPIPLLGPFTPKLPPQFGVPNPPGFRLDLSPQSVWNGDAGVGRRIGTLWRALDGPNDHKLNAAGVPWNTRFVTWDLIPTRPGGTTFGPIVLSDRWIDIPSTLPWLAYGHAEFSKWNTSLDHIPGGGWAVGYSGHGQYVAGQLTETGDWVWQRDVAPIVDYAGDVAVSRDGTRMAIVTTAREPGGVRIELQEAEVQ